MSEPGITDTPNAITEAVRWELRAAVATTLADRLALYMKGAYHIDIADEIVSAVLSVPAVAEALAQRGWFDAERTKIRAQLARHGLLAVQLQPYEDPETGWYDAKDDPEMVESLWDFRQWLEALVQP